MQTLNNPKGKIDYKTQFERAYRYQSDKLTEEDKAVFQKEDDQLIEERLKLAERKYINFFNKGAINLINKTPSSILCELGVRAFTGSRDVPQDKLKADGLFEYAAENAT